MRSPGNLIGLLCMLGLALAVWASAGPARADETYSWVDQDGVTHFTDNPNELPEPQRSQVLRKLEAGQARKRPGQDPAGLDPIPQEARDERLPPDPGAPDAGAASAPGAEPAAEPADPPAGGPPRTREQEKKLWQDKLAAARQRVADLEKECADLQEQQQTANHQFLMFGTPGSQAASAKALEAQQQCEAELAEARRYLKEGLPDEARRAGAPPGWVR